MAGPAGANHAGESSGVPVKLAAEYVHAVIQAGRATYARFIVNRLSKEIDFKVSENWEKEGALMLPAQFLLLSSQLAEAKGIGMRYRLASLWPINPQNGPASKTETTGLEKLVQNPDKPFSWVVKKGAMWYYETLFPDKAIATSCANCHNADPRSPKKDFQKGDVMGGIILDIPLGTRFHKKPDESIRIPPEVVADYMHAVLESDRTIYARLIVQRLVDQGLLAAREDWSRRQALMLPAQFLLAAEGIAQEDKLPLSFSLISQWPINPQNGPANEFERMGLEKVSVHPVRPYIGHTSVAGRRYFQSVYPDHAITPACVTCHNSHPQSPKRDFKINDVMGGIVVTFPLD